MDFEETLRLKISEFWTSQNHQLPRDVTYELVEKEILAQFRSFIGLDDRIRYPEKGSHCVAKTTNSYLCAGVNIQVGVGSHTIPKNELLKIAQKKNGKNQVLALSYDTLGAFSENRPFHLNEVSADTASKFFGYCRDCEREFVNAGIDDLNSINLTNFTLFFYRIAGWHLRMFQETPTEFGQVINNDNPAKAISNIFLNWQAKHGSLKLWLDSEAKKISILSHGWEHLFVELKNTWMSKNNQMLGFGGTTYSLKKYVQLTYKIPAPVFAMGSGMVGRQITVKKWGTKILHYYFYVFCADADGNQTLRLFVPKIHTQEVKKLKRKNGLTDQEIFAAYLIQALINPKPNIYFSAGYNEKINECLDFLHERRSKVFDYIEGDFFIKEEYRKVLGILRG